MKRKKIRANGVEFAYLEQGSGPVVVLLHGFPDTAHTWSHQMPALAAAGFRAVAPNLRGYPPTEIPQGGFYDRATLATDVAELIRTLADGAPVDLVGQDWGAAITYSVLAAYPESVRRAVVMAIPHPAETLRGLLDPRLVQRSFHWWFFQLADLPEMAVAANDFAFIDYLWKSWTGPDYRDEEHVAAVKRMLAEPGALQAALAYYRAIFDPTRADPALDHVRARLDRPITVPTLALCGDLDLREPSMANQAAHFAGPYRYEAVAGAEHFLHREKPEAVNRALVEWLAGESER